MFRMKKAKTKKVVYVIHTSFVSVQNLTDLFRELVPQVDVRHIVDDSLLAEVLQSGGVTPAVASRMCDYYKAAELAGADLIFNQCSSVGEVADLASRLVRVPVIKVDGAMADIACRTGRRIGVIATLATTLDPTCRLVTATAARVGAVVEITRELVAGAFDRLVAGDRAGHNRMVISAIRRLTRKVDVVVCAQGSMAAILSDLGETPVPVLTSPRSGVASVAKYLSRHSGRVAALKRNAPRKPPLVPTC
jgi:aspartate/glutamate racemase